MISAAKRATERGGAFYRNRKREALRKSTVLHQSIPAAPCPSPRATAGHLPALSVPGWGICKFCTARGPGICQPRGHSQAFDTHAVSYQNITYTEGFTGKKKQIGSSVKDRNKLKRVVKACSRFYACISSLLMKPELHSENRSYRCESTFLVIESNFC